MEFLRIVWCGLTCNFLSPFSLLLFALAVSMGCANYLLYKKHCYWSNLGVPSVPLSRLQIQTVQLILGRTHVQKIFSELYEELDGHKFGGSYQMARPTLILRDPELIRTCLVNNFSNFHDHHGHEPRAEPLSHNLFQLTGDKWRQVRQKVRAEAGGPIITESILVGVVSAFLTAGYEAVASTLTLCLYELALQPDIQRKILVEIRTVSTDTDKITYDDMRKLQYMEQVIQETLRKYPVAIILGRTCTEPFQIPDSTVVVEKGVDCFVPVMSIQNDPRYFPEPDVFNPDRFSAQNIGKIVPGSYLPFGDGPRSCIANRMVMISLKTMLLKIVSNYTIHSCAKTPKVVEFDGARFILTPKGNLELCLQRRR